MNDMTEASKLNIPALSDGEIYAGAIIKKDGTGHHLILLPGDNDGAELDAQEAWAKSIGGELPDRVEQALLYRDLPDQFQPDWYWSNTRREGGGAWFQHFYGGSQHWDYTYYECRARAVRRVAI